MLPCHGGNCGVSKASLAPLGERRRCRRRGRGRTTSRLPALAATAASVLLLSHPSSDHGRYLVASAADVAAAAAAPDERETRPTAAETALPVDDERGGGSIAREDGGGAGGEGGGVQYEPDLGGVEHKTATGERCHWGTAGCHAEAPSAAGAKAKTGTEGGGVDAKAGAFVPKPGRTQEQQKKKNAADAVLQKQKNASTITIDPEGGADGNIHRPPDGFVLSAHVVTDPNDGLSYFVDMNSEDTQNLLVPFLECGAVGSATERFSVKSGSFRHFPSGSDPTAWSTAGGGAGGTGAGDDESTTTSASGEHPHGNPQLVVALHPLEITVSGNSGESRTFDAGDVVLMGDTLGRGHKMRAARGKRHHNSAHPEENDLSVIVLNLPHHPHHHSYHHVAPSQPKPDAHFSAEEHLDVLGLRGPRARTPPSSASTKRGRGGPFRRERPNPCKLEHDPAYSTLGVQSPPSSPRGTLTAVPFPPVLAALGLSSPRRIVLTGVGLAASSFLTYFVYRVAPPVLGLLGVLGLAAGGTAVLDGMAGFVMEEWTAWEELRRANGLEEEDGEDDDNEAGAA